MGILGFSFMISLCLMTATVFSFPVENTVSPSPALIATTTPAGTPSVPVEQRTQTDIDNRTLTAWVVPLCVLALGLTIIALFWGRKFFRFRRNRTRKGGHLDIECGYGQQSKIPRRGKRRFKRARIRTKFRRRNGHGLIAFLAPYTTLKIRQKREMAGFKSNAKRRARRHQAKTAGDGLFFDSATFRLESTSFPQLATQIDMADPSNPPDNNAQSNGANPEYVVVEIEESENPPVPNV